MDNKNLKSQMVGSPSAAQNLQRSGYISQEEEKLISLAQNKDEIRDMVSEINTNIMNNGRVQIGEDYKISYIGEEGDYVIKGADGKLIGSSEDGDTINLSSISDQDLQNKLKQYINNVNYVSQYPDQFRDANGELSYSDQEIMKMKHFAELFNNDID